MINLDKNGESVINSLVSHAKTREKFSFFLKIFCQISKQRYRNSYLFRQQVHFHASYSRISFAAVTFAYFHKWKLVLPLCETASDQRILIETATTMQNSQCFRVNFFEFSNIMAKPPYHYCIVELTFTNVFPMNLASFKVKYFLVHSAKNEVFH